MTFVNYAVQHRDFISEFTQYSRINRIKEDNKRLSVGQMVVNNQGTIVSLNRRFISIWELPQSVVTARCERQVFRFIAKQLSKPHDFLFDIRNDREQRLLEIQEIVKLKDGRCFSHKMKLQWLEKILVGRVHLFQSLL